MFKVKNITKDDNGVTHRDEKKIVHILLEGKIEGEEGIGTKDLGDSFLHSFNKGGTILLLDLRDLEYIDTHGIAGVFNIARDLSIKECSVSLINVPTHIAEAFEVANLLPGVNGSSIFESTEAADQYLNDMESKHAGYRSKDQHYKTIILKA
jgi:anti-anti-sigma regulatory factor